MAYVEDPRISAYIKTFPDDVAQRLSTLRAAIQTTFSETIEDISYGMPTYRPAPKKRGIVHFAAFPHHIGLYAVFDPIDNPTLHAALLPYRTGKGTLQFPHNEAFPTALIKEALQAHKNTLQSA